MAAGKPWTNSERLVVFRLYCQTPFGKLHSRNPEIIALANALGRTPSAVAMKACNFASLDPIQQARNITALGNVSQDDRQLWESFATNAESIAAEAEGAYATLMKTPAPDTEENIIAPDGPTEILRTIRVCRVQGFFRATVLASYGNCCALSGLAVPELLNASHIIPWSVNTSRRADPHNGIALNALYDRAFDRGLISFDNNLRVVISNRLRQKDPSEFQQHTLLKLEGQQLHLPTRFGPDPEALAYHREHIFQP